MGAPAEITCHAKRAWRGCSAVQGYDNSLNRTKELVREEVEYCPLLEILAELRQIEQEILQGIEASEGMLR